LSEKYKLKNEKRLNFKYHAGCFEGIGEGDEGVKKSWKMVVKKS